MSSESPPERYRRRHRWPILSVIVVLLVGTGLLWVQILKPAAAAATGCNPPGPAPTSSNVVTTGAPTGSTSKTTARTTTRTTAKTSATTPSSTTTLGTFTTPSILAAVRPADPSTISLQVYNASQTRGLAKTVTDDLRSAGFVSILPAANDVLYPAQDLICAQEIRFGQAGLTEARTVLLVAPCAQLVLDSRVDASVDLTFGADYSYNPTSAAIKAQLKAIKDAATPPAVIEGQTAAPKPLGTIPPLPTQNCSAAALSASASAQAASSASSASSTPAATTPHPAGSTSG